MKNITFFVLFVAVFAVIETTDICTQKSAFVAVSQTYNFTLPSLPYLYSFIQPIMSQALLVAHHDYLHSGVVQGLNDYIATNSTLQGLTLVELVSDYAAENENLQVLAGGDYNHLLYWWMLTNPQCSQGQPQGNLLTAINSQFNNFTNFQSLFYTASINLFGSGWV